MPELVLTQNELLADFANNVDGLITPAMLRSFVVSIQNLASPIIETAVNLSSQDWTLLFAPTASLIVVKNGLVLRVDDDYSVEGDTITFVDLVQDADTFVAIYWCVIQ